MTLMMSKTWVKLQEQSLQDNASESQFYDGINVWIERPHIINRKLIASEIIHTFTFQYDKEISHGFCLNDVNFCNLKSNFSQEFNDYLNFVISTSKDSNKTYQHFLVKFRKLIPRNIDKFSDVLEAIVLDKNENSITFWPNENDILHSTITPSFPYKFKLCNNLLIMQIYRNDVCVNSTEQASEEWLKCIVFPKIFKWCCNSPAAAVLPSLKLISVKSYSEIYHSLKKKYAKQYIQIWPEISDPLKYVYEDIAIAAYLITLWEKERNDFNILTKQSFVDLGCGNGLLVDILTSEGYSGIGIDVRRRKIWDLYKPPTSLIERSIKPSDYHIFPNYDWIIGNHSDELTPWIPVIAARSNYKMKVFLLPCCSYTFNGKYERHHAGKTQYQSYLLFIQHVCESVGFNVEVDKLRIPSTKRICLVCTSRAYKEEDEENIDAIRQEFINKHSRNTEKFSSLLLDKSESSNIDNLTVNEIDFLPKENISNPWIPNFKARESVELVQNCTKLDKKFLEDSVHSIVNILLKTDNFISLQKGSETVLWNAGGKLKLSNLIQMVDPFILKNMKKQCGGFQTFLRNHRSVFTIKEGDVQLTIPSKEFSVNRNPIGKKKRHRKRIYSFQRKPCYFFFHHPQGCPLDSHDCNFFHTNAEECTSEV